MNSSTMGLVPRNEGRPREQKGVGMPTSSAQLAIESRGTDVGGEPAFVGISRSLQPTTSRPAIFYPTRRNGAVDALSSLRPQ